MNEVPRPPFSREPSQAAEGLPRWRWTLAEFDRMIEFGLLSEEDRVELIDGEMVPMHSKGGRHEHVKTLLINYFFRRLRDDEMLTVELGWRPGKDYYVEPDIVIYREGPSPSYVPAPDALLVIEISDSSLKYDLERKATIYALLGVRDYWVVDVTKLETRLHRQPKNGVYVEIEAVGREALLTPLLLPHLAVSLSQLKID